MSAQRGQRVAVVTGGTAGVGRATARQLASAGWDVAVLARGHEGLAAVSEEVESCGRRALALDVDVADASAVDAAARSVEEALGRIDLWVNVAFVGALSYFWDTSVNDFQRITEVTYLGQVNGTRAALRSMRRRDRGVVVNVGSAMAHRGIPLQAAYCGAKHAIKGFTDSVRTELRHERSRVSVCHLVLPGLNTPQFTWNQNQMPGHPMPVPPVFQPETAARAVAFLAEHPRRSMWVGLPTVYTVLGNRLAPGLYDWYLGRKGVSSQQTGRDLPRHGSNLDRPRDESADRGPHGPFDRQAHGHDPVSWLSMHRWPVAGLVTVALAGAARGLVRQ